MHNSLKEQVLESVEIVDVIGERVSLQRKGREYVGLCPFHDDHRPSMSVSPQKGIFKCWSCGAGGDVIKFVQLSQRVDFKEALLILARRAGIETSVTEVDQRAAQMRERGRNTLAWARTHFQNNLKATAGGRRAFDYSLQRGISETTIERFGIGFAADQWDDLLSNAGRVGISPEILNEVGLITTNENNKTYDRFRNRLIFPINDTTGRCVAFGGRTLGDDPAKYLNSPETPLFSKSRILYGLDLARKSITAAREVVVVEGYTDVVLLSQAGIDNVVATLGTALTDAHMKLLSHYTDRVVMCFDSDEAGLKAADRAVETALRHRVEVKVMVMGDGEDPADFVIGRGVDAFKSLLLSAIGALEFRWKRTVESFQHSGQRGQRDAIEAFLRFVARATLAGGINDPVDHGQLVNRLAGLLSLPSTTVFELLAKTKAGIAREKTEKADDIIDRSGYDQVIQGVPLSIVATVEELFGLALSSPESFTEMEEALAAGSQFCEVWKLLIAIIEDLVVQQGHYTKADVIGCCNDAVLCELVSRTSERVGSGPVEADLVHATCEHLLSELDLLQMAQYSERLHRPGGDRSCQEQAFVSLCDVASRQHHVLGAEHRWNTPQR